MWLTYCAACLAVLLVISVSLYLCWLYYGVLCLTLVDCFMVGVLLCNSVARFYCFCLVFIACWFDLSCFVIYSSLFGLIVGSCGCLGCVTLVLVFFDLMLLIVLCLIVVCGGGFWFWFVLVFAGVDCMLIVTLVWGCKLLLLIMLFVC